MEHFPRFRRKKNAAGAAHPTIIPPAALAATGKGGVPEVTSATATRRPHTSAGGKVTPPPGDLHIPAPMRPVQKLSPFRVFSRSSSKRARDSPPASLPQSPATAAAASMAAASVPGHDGVADRPVSPLSLKMEDANTSQSGKAPKMPAYLDLSEQEIDAKFNEIVWLERSRVMQAAHNPSPDFRWARVTGPHLRRLDRYMNIQPWQNNRVRLQVPEGKVDYINASPISLPPPTRTADGSQPALEPDRYIAMQGPKDNSTDHVWRMVVEQLESPGVIVMLTETHDGYMEKCCQYFPRRKEDPPLEVNERDEFGDGFRATVRCEGLEETPAGDAIELRKLVIRVRRSRGKQARRSWETTSEKANTEGEGELGEKEADGDIKMGSDSPIKDSSPPTRLPPSIPTSKFNASRLRKGAAPSASEDEQQQADDSRGHIAQEKAEEGGGVREEGEEDVEEEERIVWHFLYKKWPDFGVPDLEDLGSFFTLMQLSREKNANPNNPRIVHCSAGVGRSGTFIALEHLMRELEAGAMVDYSSSSSSSSSPTEENPIKNMSPTTTTSSSRDDGPRSSTSSAARNGQDLIFDTVNQLREQRKTMVQADSQYQFIYQVMRKLWMDKYRGSNGGASGSALNGGEMDGAGDDDEKSVADGKEQTDMAVAGGNEGGGDAIARSTRSSFGEPAPKRQEVDPFFVAQ